MATQQLTGAPVRPDHLTASVATPTLTSPCMSVRLVPAMVNGQRIHIECPTTICVTDHVAANERHLDDVQHLGPTEELAAPQALIWPSVDQPHSFLSVRIGLDPSSSNPALSRPHLIVDDEREMLFMDARQAEDFADDLILFAIQVRTMARTAAVASEVA